MPLADETADEVSSATDKILSIKNLILSILKIFKLIFNLKLLKSFY